MTTVSPHITIIITTNVLVYVWVCVCLNVVKFVMKGIRGERKNGCLAAKLI